MATSSIDKGLYAAPLGIEEDEEGMPPLEIEIEDPEAVRIGMGDIEIELTPGGDEEGGEDFDANLADYVEDSVILNCFGTFGQYFILLHAGWVGV